MANRGDQHGGQSQDQGLDPSLEAYAHSADQSMGYLETEQQGQTEDYGNEPRGAYEHGGAMNADSDRYMPADDLNQTRLPDDENQAALDEDEPEAVARRVPITGEAAEQEQARKPQIQPTPPGGNTAAEQVLQRNTRELERQEKAQAQTRARARARARARGQSSGRKRPAGTAKPTDKHAEAILDARTRIHDAIDQLASQIPYGEEFAQQTKEATDTALDFMEAQALEREAKLRRDLGVSPC